MGARMRTQIGAEKGETYSGHTADVDISWRGWETCGRPGYPVNGASSGSQPRSAPRRPRVQDDGSCWYPFAIQENGLRRMRRPGVDFRTEARGAAQENGEIGILASRSGALETRWRARQALCH